MGNEHSSRYSPHVISAGVDYFTATAQHPDAVTMLSAKLFPLLHAEQQRGNDPERWAMSGYEGISCGQAQLGSRADGAIARLSGGLADENWYALSEVAENVTRIDAQVTVFHGPQLVNALQRHYREALRCHQRNGARHQVTRWEGTDGGFTIYFGSRASERFGRVYNKEAESKESAFTGCVRYELEAKGKTARLLSARLGDGRNVPQGAASYVRRFLEDRGLSLSFLEVPATPISVHRPRTDASCSLQWLNDSVRPCVDRLRARGRLVDVLDALGLANLKPTQ
jgi:DNA relaxase NicK